MNYSSCLKFIQLRPVYRLSLYKYSALHHQQKYLESEDKWRIKDEIPKEWRLIYKAPMEKWLNYLTAYLTLSTTSMAGAGAYYTAFIYDKTYFDAPILLSEDVVLANNAMECFFYFGSFVALNVAVRVLLSKYVVRLYKKDNNYMAIFRGFWYNSIAKHTFHLDEFSKLKPNMVITWSDARFALGSKQGILFQDYFKTPEHFNYLLFKKNAKRD